MPSDDLYCHSTGLSMDTLSKEERSRRMSGVRSKGNRSTEWRLRSALMRHGIKDWRMHLPSLSGIPDFAFPRLRIAIFIDGCFWHGCPRCDRPLPKTNRTYWSNKLQFNIARAKRVNRNLRKNGFQVIRIWEHEIRRSHQLDALLSKLFPHHNR